MNMACGGFTCAKNALISLNVLYLLVSIILIGVAAYFRVTAIITSSSIIAVILSCGVFLFLIAIVGIIGASKHHQVSLFFYMIFLFLIFALQFSIACALLTINTDQQRRAAEKGWASSSDKTKKEAMKAFNCCGFNRDSQSLGPAVKEGHPWCAKYVSACEGSSAYCCTGVPAETNMTTPAVTLPTPAPVLGNNISTTVSTTTTNVPNTCPADPCLNKFETHMNEGAKTTGGVGLFFSFTEIIGVWLAYRFRNMKDPRANPNAFL